MNEFKAKILQDALSAAVEKRYGSQKREWENGGASVETDIHIDFDSKGTSHTATVRFMIQKGAKHQTLVALYEYRTSSPNREPYWYMQNDWND